MIGALETISRSISDQENTAALERVLSDDAIETSAIEGETLRRSSVRCSILRRQGLPIEQDDQDVGIDGLIAMFFDARSKIPEPLTSARILSWHAALFPTGYSGKQIVLVNTEVLQKCRSFPYRWVKRQFIASPCR